MQALPRLNAADGHRDIPLLFSKVSISSWSEARLLGLAYSYEQASHVALRPMFAPDVLHPRLPAHVTDRRGRSLPGDDSPGERHVRCRLVVLRRHTDLGMPEVMIASTAIRMTGRRRVKA